MNKWKRAAWQFWVAKDQILRLSIQASSMHYCEPREDGLNLNEYREVEMALLVGHPEAELEFTKKPSDYGIVGFDDIWSEHDDVAAYVPEYRIRDLLSSLISKFGLPDIITPG